jgi:phytoene synthase
MPASFSPTPSQLELAYSVCRSITRSAAKNFYYAFLVLPENKRQALCAVYAFMRECDDLADDVSLSIAERTARLDAWLDGFHRALAGEPTDDPVLLALTDAQRRFRIQIGWLDQLAYGTAMDVQEPHAASPGADGIAQSKPATRFSVQYRSFEELGVYCYRVASVVGLVCISIFGYHDPAAEPLAERCGLAFQLTNIIRDVKEDAEMGRVYLPQQDLERFGLSAEELAGSSDPRRFAPLLEMEADRARELYLSGDQLLPYIDEDSRPALWVLVTTYRRLLEKIAATGYNVFADKIRLSSTEKLAILGKGFLRRLLG